MKSLFIKIEDGWFKKTSLFGFKIYTKRVLRGTEDTYEIISEDQYLQEKSESPFSVFNNK